MCAPPHRCAPAVCMAVWSSHNERLHLVSVPLMAKLGEAGERCRVQRRGTQRLSSDAITWRRRPLVAGPAPHRQKIEMEIVRVRYAPWAARFHHREHFCMASLFCGWAWHLWWHSLVIIQRHFLSLSLYLFFFCFSDSYSLWLHKHLKSCHPFFYIQVSDNFCLDNIISYNSGIFYYDSNMRLIISLEVDFKQCQRKLTFQDDQACTGRSQEMLSCFQILRTTDFLNPKTWIHTLLPTTVCKSPMISLASLTANDIIGWFKWWRSLHSFRLAWNRLWNMTLETDFA